jgi:hypothetical protein
MQSQESFLSTILYFIIFKDYWEKNNKNINTPPKRLNFFGPKDTKIILLQLKTYFTVDWGTVNEAIYFFR